MPDVTRSDSQRSDTSNRPRVSFNRDVHVKRIVPREGGRVVGALSGDGAGHLVASPVRKERLNKSKKELAEEAARVIHQVDRIDCVSDEKGVLPEKFYTLPNRKKKPEFSSSSLDRRTGRRGSLDLVPPKKPPRTFASLSTPHVTQKNSIFDIFKKKPEPKKSNLRRSVSDATNLKSRVYGKLSGSDNEDPLKNKKQLSPIIEVSQREDYFETEDKENQEIKAPVRRNKSQSVTDKLRQYIDEVDEALYKETGIRVSPPKEVKAPVIVIDVDKAEKIKPKSKLNLGKKFKGIGKKNKNDGKSEKTVEDKAPLIKAAIDSLENPDKSTMIHSSQKPAEKLPLTKGRTVDSMVKRLSNDSSSPPPKTNILLAPNPSMQHNNNQPFSYTRGLSPEKYMSSENLQSPIIYAQVVCGNNANGPNKQTVHTAYTNGKKQPHSDSDEGLGGEESLNRKYLYDRKKDYFDEDKFEEESPITPKFNNPAFMNGFGYEVRTFKEENYIDSSSRGRGDGMDAKRRESLTEPFENGFGRNNGRSDLSARRDLLESRINRRINDKARVSPEYRNGPTNVYITESSSKYYRSGSSSPVGFKEKYEAETKMDKGERYTTETRSKKYFGDAKESREYENRLKGNYYLSYENEPKSFDSQVSDYRSSPENRHFEASQKKGSNRYQKTDKLVKDRAVYKSNPEIHHRFEDQFKDSYHDSLRRENNARLISSSKYRSERYLNRTESERKDKFGDSGIENDFRRDSTDYRQRRNRRDYGNDSEDEGFASSLLIASERQHTEDNINNRKRRDYDSDRAYSREEDPYRYLENMEYKSKYIPRERSIDDGSHYDPRIDKETRSTLKKVDKKPPKPEKKSGLEKMKQLFSRDSKKKKEKQNGMVREESLRARYIEYKGRDEAKKKKDIEEVHGFDYSNRRRLSTPSPSPTRDVQRNGKSDSTHGSWFKSLDRLSRKKTKKSGVSTDDESTKPMKNLRFFGDTDQESNDSVRQKSRTRPGIITNRIRSQSSRDLHNISEERRSPDIVRKSSHKSMTNISEDIKGSKMSLKPPISPNHRQREVRGRDDRNRRRKNEVSSVESSTEGDSSQQSQRSIVYLHAATVGDIPGPGYLKNGRRAASREELASNGSSRLQPQVKTLSRSFSVLAPWKPRHYREAMDIDYTQYPKKNGKYEQKIAKNSSSRKENSSTLKKKAQETRKSNQSSLNRKSKSNQNLLQIKRSNNDLHKASSTLYKKKEKLPRENSRYNRDRDEGKRMIGKTLSVESLGSGRNRRGREDIARSVSMPRDPEKSAGWFGVSKKTSGSTQRL